MKDKILHILNQPNDIKTNYSLIKKDKKLMDYLDSITSQYNPESFPEKIYILKNNFNPICKNGIKKPFIDGNVGFRFCGRATKCKCAFENQSKKISYSKQQMSEEDIKQSNKKRHITNIQKYGNDYKKQFQKKAELNNLQKYGVKTTLLEQNTKQKIIKTLKQKYGVNHPLKAKIIRDKARKTFFKKYNVKSNILRVDVKEKLNLKKEKLGITGFSSLSLNEKALNLVTNCELLKKEYL